MKKLIVFGLCAMTIACTGAILYGRASSPIQSKATGVLSDAFIAGTMNSWLGNGKDGVERDEIRSGTYDAYRFEFIRADDYGSSYYTLTIDLNNGDTFGIRDWHDGRTDSNWCTNINSTDVKYGIVIEGGNYKCTLSGTYTLTYRFKDNSSRCLEKAVLSSSYQDIYVVNNAEWSDTFLHAWKYEGGATTNYTTWESCITSAAGNICLGTSDYELHVLRIPSDANFFIFGGSDSKKTADLGSVDGKAYLTGDSVEGLEVSAAIVGEIVSYMDEAEYQEETFLYSICAIPFAKASDIVTKYEAAKAVPAAKAILDNSYVTTYDPEDVHSSANVSISSICAQLATFVDGSKTSLKIPETQITPIIPIIIVGAFTVAAYIGVSIYFKKRQQ